MPEIENKFFREHILQRTQSIVNTFMRQVVDNCRTFMDFIKEGLIEYLDVNEENKEKQSSIQ